MLEFSSKCQLSKRHDKSRLFVVARILVQRRKASRREEFPPLFIPHCVILHVFAIPDCNSLQDTIKQCWELHQLGGKQRPRSRWGLGLETNAGASHDSPRAQTCTFEAGLQTPPKFHEKTYERKKKD